MNMWKWKKFNIYNWDAEYRINKNAITTKREIICECLWWERKINVNESGNMYFESLIDSNNHFYDKLQHVDGFKGTKDIYFINDFDSQL